MENIKQLVIVAFIRILIVRVRVHVRVRVCVLVRVRVRVCVAPTFQGGTSVEIMV